jgi:choline dehydrogenase-like flavoprotein
VSMFDAIVIGGGMYGAYCAHQIWRRGGKVLLLEAGPFFLSEHGQNLARDLGFDAPDAILPTDPQAQVTRKEVWGTPWRGNQIFPGLAFCVGGKSLFWGGWSPRLTDDALSDYPLQAKQWLDKTYERVELQLGVTTLDSTGKTVVTTGFIDETGPGGLTQQLRQAIDKAIVDGRVPASVEKTQRAPVAAQGDNPTSGLFSFDKFSPIPLLTEAIREDIRQSNGDDARRNLCLVSLCRVLRLDMDSSGSVSSLQVFADGQRKTLSIPPSCNVVLACSCIESTRLALESFPTSQIGRNLMVHLRSDVAVRIPRSLFPNLQKGFVETGALHIPAKTASGGRYHIQVVAGANRENNGEGVWFRTVPDSEMLEGILRNDDPNYVSVVFRGIGEMLGVKDEGTPNPGSSWIDLSAETDEFGMRRAYVHLKTTQVDDELWNEMDQAMYRIAAALGQEPKSKDPPDKSRTEFWFDGSWIDAKAAKDRVTGGKLKTEQGIRDSLGTTYHESGTMWMGEAPFSSPTDGRGRFRHVANAYCADQSLFTRGGSANPVPTGLTLARGVAAAITGQDDSFVLEEGFRSLLQFSNRVDSVPDGWSHFGGGFFRRRGTTVEAVDNGKGIGLLVYTREEFADFVLRLEWRAPSLRNNSGVYVRLPAARLGIFGSALTSGYEIQIDNTGERPGGDASSFSQAINIPHHQTGAIYPVHTSASFPDPNGQPTTGSIPTKRFGEWNQMEIIAQGNRLRVLLNGQPTLAGGEYVDRNSTYLRGHIALQQHFKGFGVQFRRIRIKTL